MASVFLGVVKCYATLIKLRLPVTFNVLNQFATDAFQGHKSDSPDDRPKRSIISDNQDREQQKFNQISSPPPNKNKTKTKTPANQRAFLWSFATSLIKEITNPATSQNEDAHCRQCCLPTAMTAPPSALLSIGHKQHSRQNLNGFAMSCPLTR